MQLRFRRRGGWVGRGVGVGRKVMECCEIGLARRKKRSTRGANMIGGQEIQREGGGKRWRVGWKGGGQSVQPGGAIIETLGLQTEYSRANRKVGMVGGLEGTKSKGEGVVAT